MKKIAPIIALTAFVAGCGEPNPIVADFNGDSVKIQTHAFDNADEARASATAEAQRICQKGHKKRAEYASSRNLPNYIVEHLFLCLS